MLVIEKGIVAEQLALQKWFEASEISDVKTLDDECVAWCLVREEERRHQEHSVMHNIVRKETNWLHLH